MWGSSFLFMKIAVPSMGPVAMIEARVAIAAIVLSAFAWATRKSWPRGRQWVPCFFIGVFYTAIPLLLWAYAARSASASLLSIINATAPLFGALISLLWLREKPTARGGIGLLLGFAGVALLVGGEGFGNRFSDSNTAALAVGAALCAAFLYGLMANYTETVKQSINAYTQVLGSTWIATLLIAPMLIWFPVNHTPPQSAWWSVLALGVLSTALAYILYFRLIDKVGPASALSVTYLIPVFGTLWGVLFLDETIGVHTIAGGAMIIAGIALLSRARVQSSAQTPQANQKLPLSDP